MTVTQIAQSYLDAVSEAVTVNDYDTYSTYVSLPFYMVTTTRTIVIQTDAELQQIFVDFYQTLKSQRVTQYIRLVESATQLDHDLISARYLTHLLSGATRLIDPFRSQITLRLEGNQWRAASITNALSNSQWPFAVLRTVDFIPPKGPENE